MVKYLNLCLNKCKGKKRSNKLSLLLKKEFGESIQEGEHDSVEDARGALLLYRKYRVEWEKEVMKKKRRYRRSVTDNEDESLLKE